MLSGIRAILAIGHVALAMAAVGHAAAASAGEAEAGSLAEGRLLYMDGKRTDGAPLVAKRVGGLSVTGATAACVNCHRRSGYGGSEGRSYIPPITGASLFERKAPGTGASASGTGRPAYSDESLARVIRSGVDPAGRHLDYLMPRYELQEEEIRSLVAYLRQLPTRSSPRAETDTLHFATVVAPGVQPARRKAMVDVLRACFDDHNAGPPAEQGRKRLGPNISLSRQAKWRLHVWDLHGESESWNAQLSEHEARQLVFAMVGGLGSDNWAPVHEYCELGALPCLFPHVDAPVVAENGFYSLYLSRGVSLEAAIIASHLAQQVSAPRRVIQVLRAEDASARAGAEALRRTLAQRGIGEQELRITQATPLDARTFDGTRATDALVLWLRADDLKRLDGINPVPAQTYISATLAEVDPVPLPTAWKVGALIPYPFELPQIRAARSAPLHAWLRAHGLALVDERVQADAYIACAALKSGMNEIADHLHRDYLVERLEAILERGTFAGHYPRLALGTGQRFASKTGYLVRFDDPESGAIVPIGERIAP